MDKLICTNCGKDNKSNAKYCSECGYELPKVQVKTNVLQSQQNNSAKTDKRKKLIGTIIGVVVFGLSYIIVQQIFFAPPSTDKVLMQTASEINKTCPVMVDQVTRMDNAVALPNNTFQYNYTIVSNEKSEINLDTVKKYIEPVIINRVKTEPDLKYFRDKKVTMVYNYRDKNGVFVVKFSVTPDMYKE